MHRVRKGCVPSFVASLVLSVAVLLWVLGTAESEAFSYTLSAERRPRQGQFNSAAALSNNGWLATTCFVKGAVCPVDILRRLGDNRWKWNQQIKMTNFVHNMAMSNDGAVLAAGLGEKGCSGGRVFIYRRKKSGKYVKHQTILSPDAINKCYVAKFGRIVELSKDGTILATVSHEEDPPGSSAMIYTKRSSNKWTMQVRFRSDALSNTIALAGNGKTLAIKDAQGGVIRFAERLKSIWTTSVVMDDPNWLTAVEIQLSVDGLVLAVRSLETISVYTRSEAGEPFVSQQSIIAWSATNLVGQLRLLDDASRIIYSTRLQEDDRRNASLAVTVLDRDSETGFYSQSEVTALGGSNAWGRFSPILQASANGEHLSLLADDDYYGHATVYVFDRVPVKPSPGPKPSICRPSGTLTKAQCTNRIAACNNGTHHQPMKWAGAGCKKNNKPLRDGGCRCVGYCRYKCRKACEKDVECRWDGARCVVDATGEPTEKRAEC